jgi:hypothetical protein
VPLHTATCCVTTFSATLSFSLSRTHNLPPHTPRCSAWRASTRRLDAMERGTGPPGYYEALVSAC